MIISERRLEKLLDEWCRLNDLAVAAYRLGATAEHDELTVKAEEAWQKYQAAAQASQEYEREARHDEGRPEWDEMSFE